jgi:uncharacterized protein (TIGR02265 family)
VVGCAPLNETFGRYQLIQKLATGGMGQVYLARQQGPVGFEKLMVVKRVLPHLAEEDEFIQMFFDEARIAAHLNHPNIAQIYDLGEVQGVYYIAMEYVHGESVRAVNARANLDRGGMPLALKCRILADAAAGLDFAHRAKSASGVPLGLIHRDVSPQNVLVGFNGSVKLIDFGVAKARNKVSHTLTGAIKGKYAYMSPEQARGETLDPRSDVFGLGIVFYELLTSSRLFKRDSDTETMKAVVGAKVLPPSSLVKGVPKVLDNIVLKALAKNRKDRFQTAGDFLLEIEDFLIRQRLPSTNAHLAAFMQDLYGDFLAAAKAANEPSQVTMAPVQGSVSNSLSLSQAERPVSAKTGLTSKTGSKSSSNKAVVVADLDARLSATDPSDTSSGLFFNALLKKVSEKVGDNAPAEVKNAAINRTREYKNESVYPTTDFLRVLWKSAELLAPKVKTANTAFFELGAACMQSLLNTPENSALQKALTRKDAERLVPALLSVLEKALQPGERRLESLTTKGATLVHRRDLLPPAFNAGLHSQALSSVLKKTVKVEFDRKGDLLSYRASWT